MVAQHSGANLPYEAGDLNRPESWVQIPPGPLGNVMSMFIEEYARKYKKRFVRAIRTVREHRVQKLLIDNLDKDIWLITSSTGSKYLVIPGTYCSCTDFLINVVIKRKVDKCYHLIAQEIASKTGAFSIASITDLREFFKEIFKYM